MEFCIRYFITWTLLLFSFYAVGQQLLLDSFARFDSIVYEDIYAASELLGNIPIGEENIELKGQLLKRKAIAARIKGRYNDALTHNLEALEIFTAQNNLKEAAEINHNMGFLMRYIEDYDNALKYFDETIKIRETIEDSTSLGLSHREIGVIYRRKEDFEKALHHYSIAETLFDPIEDRNEMITLQGNYASLYYIQEKYDDAIEVNKKAIPEIKKTNNVKALATRYGNIGNAYRKLKQYDAAILYIDSAIQISENANLLEPQVRYYEHKARIRYYQKEYKNAYRCMRRHRALKDKLNERAKLSSVENQLKAFEYKKRILKDSIESVFETTRLENKVKYERQKRMNYVWLSLFIVLSLISILVWQFYRVKLSKLKAKHEQLKSIQLQSKLESTTKENKRLVNQTQLQLEFKKSILEQVDAISEANKSPNTRIRDLKLELLDQLRIENQSNTINESLDDQPSEFEEFLQKNYPELTKGERKLCFLVRSGLTIKEITRLNQTSSGAVQSMRYRIRRKMKLERGQELQAYLNSIF